MAGTRRRPAGPPATEARGRSTGIGRPSSPRAERISDDLRRGNDPNLTRRRRIAGLSLTAIGTLGTVAAYQMGLIRHLPELPLPGLDADTVDASGEAYAQLVTPDAALGIASYAVTLILAGMGARDRARTQPWIPLALAAKVGLDTAGSVFLGVEQASKHRAFCGWCLAATGASLAMLPQALPEAREAWRHLRRG